MNLGIRRAAAVLAAAGLAAAAGALPASADTTVPVTGGSGDWGVKLSFRNYLKSPVAHGSTEVAGGVTENSDGTFAFPVVSGSYDPQSGDTVVQFGGSVHFEGHGGVLQITIEDLRVEVVDGEGTLYADMASSSPSNPALTEYDDIALAELDLSGGQPSLNGGTLSLGSTPTTLTQAGSTAFAGFYAAGAAMDPISFTATVANGSGGGSTPPPASGQSANQQILADVAAGPLTLSVAGDTVQLSTSTLDGNGAYQTATGALNTATVSDLRGTNAGWNLVGQVTDFTGDAGTIGAENLGWQPSAAAVDTGIGAPGTVTAGNTVQPGQGLGVARTLASAAPGASAGTFTAGAQLSLGIPADTVPGDYAAVLTLTLS